MEYETVMLTALDALWDIMESGDYELLAQTGISTAEACDGMDAFAEAVRHS